MKKFCATGCTVGFSAFWIFGGLAVVSLANGQPVAATVLPLCAQGLALGIFTRRRVVTLTQDVPQGTLVRQMETPRI